MSYGYEDNGWSQPSAVLQCGVTLCLVTAIQQCTVGDEGVIGDLSSESISAHFQGLPTRVQLAATT